MLLKILINILLSFISLFIFHSSQLSAQRVNDVHIIQRMENGLLEIHDDAGNTYWCPENHASSLFYSNNLKAETLADFIVLDLPVGIRIPPRPEKKFDFMPPLNVPSDRYSGGHSHSYEPYNRFKYQEAEALIKEINITLARNRREQEYFKNLSKTYNSSPNYYESKARDIAPLLLLSDDYESFLCMVDSELSDIDKQIIYTLACKMRDNLRKEYQQQERARQKEAARRKKEQERREREEAARLKKEQQQKERAERDRLKREQKEAEQRKKEQERREQEQFKKELDQFCQQEKKRQNIVKNIRSAPSLPLKSLQECAELRSFFESVHLDLINEYYDSSYSVDSTTQILQHERLNAVAKMVQNPDLVFEWDNNFDKIVLEECPYAEFFQNTKGNAIDLQLHKELSATLQDASHQLHNYHHNQQVAALAPVVQEYAAMARHAQDYKAAFLLADFCRNLNKISQGFVDLCNNSAVVKVGKAVAKGALDSVYNQVTYALDNPTAAAVDLGVLLFAPEYQATVALCRLGSLAYTAYQNRAEILEAGKNFIHDVWNEAYNDPEWVASHAHSMSEFVCDLFVLPHVSKSLRSTRPVAPLVNGIRKQTEILQSSLQNTVNTVSQKACSSLKNMLQEFGNAYKTEDLQVALANFDAPVSLRTVADHIPLGGGQGICKKVQGRTEKIRKVEKNILDDMESLTGHTIDQHVSKFNQNMIKRGIDESRKAKKRGSSKSTPDLISSFSNKSKAIEAVQQNLKHHAHQIAEWVLDETSKDTKIFDFTHSRDVGRGIPCGKKGGFIQLTASRIVLRKDERHPLGFIIVTAFPIEKLS